MIKCIAPRLSGAFFLTISLCILPISMYATCENDITPEQRLDNLEFKLSKIKVSDLSPEKAEQVRYLLSKIKITRSINYRAIDDIKFPPEVEARFKHQTANPLEKKINDWIEQESPSKSKAIGWFKSLSLFAKQPSSP